MTVANPKRNPTSRRGITAPLFILAAIAMASSAGCSTVCEDADELCPDPEVDPAEEGPECTGEFECASECIVDVGTCDVAGRDDVLDCFRACEERFQYR